MLEGSESVVNTGILEIKDFLYHDPRFTFHATGSRYFGNVTEKSDFDYFAKDSPELESELLRRGFRMLGEPYGSGPAPKGFSRDKEILRLARFTCATEGASIQIDIQLVENYERRCAIIEIAKHSGLIPTLPKDRRSDFWNALYFAYMQGTAVKKKKRFISRLFG